MAKKSNSSGSKDNIPSVPSSASRVEMNEIVLPSHTNALGTIFGGQVMAWIDIAGAISASRHARKICVTASIDTLHFLAPIRSGEHVRLLASVNFTNNTSMEVGVRVESDNFFTGKRTKVATAYLTFVALDEKGRPTAVPKVRPETEEEERRYKEAQLRRDARLKLKQALRK